MATVKTVKVDGEEIHIFNSAIYIFETNTNSTLSLDLIISEVSIKKFRKEETLITEIELEDNTVIHSIMYVKVLPSRLPHLHLFCEADDSYDQIDRFVENAVFPDVEAGITLEEIRKVEMPNEQINLKLTLPIDQVEWLKVQKKQVLNEMFKQMVSKSME